MKKSGLPLLALFVFLFTGCTRPVRNILLIDEVCTASTEFAFGDMKLALNEAGYKVGIGNTDFVIRVKQEPSLVAQAYILEKHGDTLRILCGDETGGMYGILDVAEQVDLHGDIRQVKEKKASPFIEHRGIKMNIALDGRLPSYDDTGDAAQENIAEMWNMDFWEEYLDELARHRYNLLSFWSKHPFPALIKMEDYPGAEMEDVYVFNEPVTWEMQRDWREVDQTDLSRFRKIKSMTIDEKIAFWQKVMEYAHDRGIDIIWFTWNIFITPNFQEELKPESDEAIAYMRTAVQEMVETYPYLSGFGVTAGERMGMTVGKYTNVQWLWETYGKGVAAAKEAEPDRPFRFIFRRHHTRLPDIDADFTAHFPGEVETSYKFNVAHMYSTYNAPIFEQEYLPQVLKYDYKCWMNVRNDDIFTFRWGDPEYARKYLKTIMKFPIPGFYMGSDGYLWGREFTAKNPELSGELEITKHWYRYMLWGRLAYDPELPDDFFIKHISHRLPEADELSLFNAWRMASKIFPATTNFHWKVIDAMWAPEGCMEQGKGFQTLRDFIDCYTLEKTHLQNISDYADMIKAGEESELLSPFELADSLRYCAAETFKYLETAVSERSGISAELEATLNDIECFALYGEYYAAKIEAATWLHMYECLSGPDKAQYKDKALDQAELALEAWRKLALIADGQYETQLLARTRELDWVKTIEYVEKDIDIIRNSTGEETKLVRLFYSGHANLDPDRDLGLRKALEENGYEVEIFPGWKVEGFASGLKVVVAINGDLISKFFYTRGGELPLDYEKTGLAIVAHRGKIWVIGEDHARVNLALGKLTAMVETNDLP